MARHPRLLAILAAQLALLSFPALSEEGPGDKGIGGVKEHALNWLKGRRHAFIVGVSDYRHLRARKEDPQGRDRAYDLDFADDDALAIEDFLKNELKYDTVRCLTESQASRDAILDQFGKLVQAAKPFDTVFVYLSGHGFKKGKKTYFMPWDGKAGSALGHRGIDLKEIFSNELRDCGADHKLLVLDCCHSGAATGKAIDDAASFSRDDLRDLSGRGLYVLTSCKKDEVAYEDEKSGHGFFTHFLLEALNGRADKFRLGNHDGLVAADEVYYYLYEYLPDAVRKAKRGTQTPQREVPMEGQTFVARVGRIEGGEVTFRLKSEPDGAEVLINDEPRGRTPLESALELGVPQRIVASKKGFLPWERKLNPQTRDPIELKALLRPEGAAQDTTYTIAGQMYERGKAKVALELLEVLITDKKPDAPRALLFLVQHHLKAADLEGAEAKANALRRDYGQYDESAQADGALYEQATAKLDARKPSERGLEWHQTLILSLKDFVRRQPGNRNVEAAQRRLEHSSHAVRNQYLNTYHGRADRLLADIEDELFDAARKRLAKVREVLEEAERHGYELAIPEGRRPEALRKRLEQAERDHAERAAYRAALALTGSGKDFEKIAAAWEAFLRDYPKGKLAVQATEFREKAKARLAEWRQEQRDRAEKADFDAATAAAAGAKDPDGAIPPWEQFLKAHPEGKLTAQAEEALKKARERAAAWHEAEHTKSMAEAQRSRAAKDYATARKALAHALLHRPNDPAALAFRKTLVPVLVITTTPPGATIEFNASDHSPPITHNELSPCRIKVTENATYTIRLSKQGYLPAMRKVGVRDGGEHRVEITLEEEGEQSAAPREKLLAQVDKVLAEMRVLWAKRLLGAEESTGKPLKFDYSYRVVNATDRAGRDTRAKIDGKDVQIKTIHKDLTEPMDTVVLLAEAKSLLAQDREKVIYLDQDGRRLLHAEVRVLNFVVRKLDEAADNTRRGFEALGQALEESLKDTAEILKKRIQDGETPTLTEIERAMGKEIE